MSQTPIGWALCHTCRHKHALTRIPDGMTLRAQKREWRAKHEGHRIAYKHAWECYAPNSNVKQAFDADTSLTCSANALASGSQRSSAAVDNSANLYVDALLRVQFTLAAGSPSTGVNVYLYGSEDGTNYDGASATIDNVDGTDKAVTLQSPTNLTLLGGITTITSGAITYKKSFYLARAFGGALPYKWGVVIDNETGLAFASSSALTLSYRGLYYTVLG